jgi:hypothetical protein
MLYMEAITSCSEIRTKQINASTAELTMFSVKLGGSHWSLLAW